MIMIYASQQFVNNNWRHKKGYAYSNRENTQIYRSPNETYTINFNYNAVIEWLRVSHPVAAFQ